MREEGREVGLYPYGMSPIYSSDLTIYDYCRLLTEVLLGFSFTTDSSFFLRSFICSLFSPELGSSAVALEAFAFSTGENSSVEVRTAADAE